MQIAIVDDSADNLDSLTKLVEAIGFKVAYADGSVPSLLQAKDLPIDLILLNTSLIEECGDTTLTRIKNLQPSIYLPIILIANNRDSAEILKHLQLGADDFHSKPFDGLILEAKLKAHIRTRELSKTLAENNRKLAWHSKNVQQEHKIV